MHVPNYDQVDTGEASLPKLFDFATLRTHQIHVNNMVPPNSAPIATRNTITNKYGGHMMAVHKFI